MDFDKVFTAFRNCISEPKCKDCPWEQCEQFNQKKVSIPVTLALDVLNLLKEQKARIQKYEYVFDFLGIGFRQWGTKILDGEAEAICETDEHEHKMVITFKMI